MISKANEEYLKTIYLLNKNGIDVKVTNIAKNMNCSKPSVNKALNILKENELIEYETYGSIKLTKKGEELAKKNVEAYDIAYTFFKNVLKLDDEKAKEQAKSINTALDDNTLNNLAKHVSQEQNQENKPSCNYDINLEACRSCKKMGIERQNNG